MSEAGSGIEGFRHKSAFATYIAGQLKTESLKLVDIGCAGGLAGGWRAFGDRLAAIGFDTNAEEIERLKAAETNRAVRYVAGWVGMPDDHPLKVSIGSKAYWHQWPSARLAYERTYNVRNAKAEGREPQSLEDYFHKTVLQQDWLTTPVGGYDLDYARTFEVHPVSEAEAAEALKPPTKPDPLIHLPPYLKASGFYDCDFLKLDIDGPDYEVLRSLSDLLTKTSLIGVSLEVSYYGSHDANDNSFHNMDRLMREKGFDLFGLSVRTYASAALPYPYLDAHPSMNAGGRPLQGDALYIRDLGSRVRREEAAGLSTEKLAKTAALFSLFTLPDCAAEILIVHRQRLAEILDVDHALDLLAEEIQADSVIAKGFKAYTAAFEADNPRFFDLYTARNRWWHETTQAAAQAPAILENTRAEAAERLQAVAEDLDRAREKSAQLEARLEQTRVELRNVQDRVRDMEGSSSWRITAPLRGLFGALKGKHR